MSDTRSRGWLGELAVLLIALFAGAAIYAWFIARPVERTEKKVEKQVVTTGVAQKATSAAVKKKTIDTTGFTFDSRRTTKARTTTTKTKRSVTRKRVTTTFDPATGAPTSRTEEDLVVKDSSGSRDESAGSTISQGTSATQSSGSSVASAQTSSTAQATQEAIHEATQETTESTAKPSPPKLGLAVTSTKKTGLTYDFARKGPFTLSGMVAIDLKRGEVAGVGAGINTDVWFRGRNYVGVYGMHESRSDTTKVIGCIGHRF